MENLKIKVNNEAESKEAQELFFELGYEWYSTKKKIDDTRKHIYADIDGDLTYSTNGKQRGEGFKEITLQELRTMTTPQHKEYLDPHNNYELIEWDGGFMVQEHWIEVPMGAEILADTWVGLIFYKKKDCESFEFSHAGNCEWSLTPTNPYNDEGFVGALVWQRDTQPSAMNADADSEAHGGADELFASVLGTTAWDAQVGGNHYKQFKIQPMQFALENNLDAAQHNVIKYVMRHASKNGKEDLEKAKHYIDLMIQHYYGAQ